MEDCGVGGGRVVFDGKRLVEMKKFKKEYRR